MLWSMSYIPDDMSDAISDKDNNTTGLTINNCCTFRT